ncbi:MAG: chromosome partitioning protein [Micromonosporaceae bacterium]|nr:chromosome partitioning protein [Micromonosporaceae bacterium]
MASLKASPGVTTAMVALAAVWPAGRQVLMVEADPDGGVLAARFGLSTEPGLASAAPGLRREVRYRLVSHIQRLPGGAAALFGPSSPDQARLIVTACAGRLCQTLAEAGEDALVDCGRLVAGSPAMPVAAAADLLVLVARPRLDELQHLAHRLPALLQTSRNVGLVLIGGSPYGPAEVEHALDEEMTFVAQLADDPRAAAALNGHGGASVRRLAHSQLVRSARSVVRQVLSVLPVTEPERVAKPSASWEVTAR